MGDCSPRERRNRFRRATSTIVSPNRHSVHSWG
uniref:Uncharacterized protein n=1 Tax=Nymphaea colorata TaxID=210225 RepID=A0A5K1EY66_9MAGN|nr:unnamed protein product [Nymphaea colorata]